MISVNLRATEVVGIGTCGFIYLIIPGEKPNNKIGECLKFSKRGIGPPERRKRCKVCSFEQFISRFLELEAIIYLREISSRASARGPTFGAVL